MKVLIWIKKEDVISVKITEHHLQCPQPGYQNYVQVEITQDEFVKLEDRKKNNNTNNEYPPDSLSGKPSKRYSI